MSNDAMMRRAERAMTGDDAMAFLESGFSGCIAVTSEEGSPYCVPLLYVLIDGAVHLHTSAARGRLRRSVERDSRACFTVCEPGLVYDYGRFECDSGLAYRSVMVSGSLALLCDATARQRFCEALMRKYGTGVAGRPPGFFPRLELLTIYRLEVASVTGKAVALPDESQRWPACDRTATPDAVAPVTARPDTNT